MIGETGDLDPKIIPDLLDKSCQDPYTVPQQIRITGIMNIAVNTGAIRAYGSTFFNFFLLGKTENLMIDEFPGLSRNALNVPIQRRFLETFVGDSNTAEPPKALRIHDVEGKRFVTEIEKGFYHSATQNLISAHAVCARSFERQFSPIQILQNKLTDGRLAVR